MRIISFIDRADVIKKILQHLGLGEESHAPPQSEPGGKEIKVLTFDPSYSQLHLTRSYSIEGLMSSPVRSSVPKLT